MRIKRPKHDPLNDGYLTYGYRVIKRNEQRKRIGTKFEPVGELAFSIVSARESDIEIAQSYGKSLDLKVKTWFPPNFNKIKKTDMVCVVNDIEHDVIRSDWDKERRYIYWYLQEVGSSEST